MLYLKVLRVKAGLTQKDMANEFGTTIQTISRWESGITIPPMRKLLKMSLIFDCPIGDLVQDVPDQHGWALRRMYGGISEH